MPAFPSPRPIADALDGDLQDRQLDPPAATSAPLIGQSSPAHHDNIPATAPLQVLDVSTLLSRLPSLASDAAGSDATVAHAPAAPRSGLLVDPTASTAAAAAASESNGLERSAAARPRRRRIDGKPGVDSGVSVGGDGLIPSGGGEEEEEEGLRLSRAGGRHLPPNEEAAVRSASERARLTATAAPPSLGGRHEGAPSSKGIQAAAGGELGGGALQRNGSVGGGGGGGSVANPYRVEGVTGRDRGGDMGRERRLQGTADCSIVLYVVVFSVIVIR